MWANEMSKNPSYLRGIAARARELRDEAPDRAARELLKAIARIYEAEAERAIETPSVH